MTATETADDKHSIPRIHRGHRRHSPHCHHPDQAPRHIPRVSHDLRGFLRGSIRLSIVLTNAQSTAHRRYRPMDVSAHETAPIPPGSVWEVPERVDIPRSRNIPLTHHRFSGTLFSTTAWYKTCKSSGFAPFSCRASPEGSAEGGDLNDTKYLVSWWKEARAGRIGRLRRDGGACPWDMAALRGIKGGVVFAGKGDQSR